jgi:hypothetical protein
MHQQREKETFLSPVVDALHSTKSLNSSVLSGCLFPREIVHLMVSRSVVCRHGLIPAFKRH